jgi:hypothetical protein
MADLHRKIMGSCWCGEQHILGLGYSNLCPGLDVAEEEKEGMLKGWVSELFFSELRAMGVDGSPTRDQP